ncbi:hypothetical protein L210DRAFT_2414022 [Boletus edulis BED1]|uniref:Uncharacterized protein n=1 Tax=Boletus edulis BED1 TaxID=1328754 RepID=A0AAD4C708_BOLED|nr:hypothetical protein L210DRAFT_2414022 [Boletus edulis BED1]
MAGKVSRANSVWSWRCRRRPQPCGVARVSTKQAQIGPLIIMEDTQPNEVRLSRKGFTNIPPMADAPPEHRNDQCTCTQLVELHLPRECHKGAPGNHSARKRWIEDQKYRLWTHRHLSVVSFRYIDHDNSVQFDCRTQQASQPTGHHARDSMRTGSHHVDAQLGTESACSTRHAPSGVKGYHTSVTQSKAAHSVLTISPWSHILSRGSQSSHP